LAPQSLRTKNQFFKDKSTCKKWVFCRRCKPQKYSRKKSSIKIVLKGLTMNLHYLKRRIWGKKKLKKIKLLRNLRDNPQSHFHRLHLNYLKKLHSIVRLKLKSERCRKLRQKKTCLSSSHVQFVKLSYALHKIKEWKNIFFFETDRAQKQNYYHLWQFFRVIARAKWKKIKLIKLLWSILREMKIKFKISLFET
jgi:hypothetical protein